MKKKPAALLIFGVLALALAAYGTWAAIYDTATAPVAKKDNLDKSGDLQKDTSGRLEKDTSDRLGNVLPE